MANLTDKCMLVRLSISQWQAKKFDKAISAKVAADYGTDQDAGRYSKVLIAEESIKTVSKVANDARTFHYAQTLPWNDSGERILPAANYLPYTQKMQEYRQVFEAAVRSFIDSYPDLVSDARIRLNGMFNPLDYPNAGRIMDLYRFGVDVMPMPDSSDFRVDLSQSDVDLIKQDIEVRVQTAQDIAMRDLWDRLHEAVSHMADKLSDDKAIFRDSLVGNVRELVDLLPRLNITDDPNLTSMTAEVGAKLAGYGAQELRDSPMARKAAAVDARAILDAMAGYTG